MKSATVATLALSFALAAVSAIPASAAVRDRVVRLNEVREGPLAVSVKVGRSTTPLYQAAVHGVAPIVALLLAAGATPDLESGHGTEGTPLCAAALWAHDDVVRELLAYGADPELREDGGTGHTPLDWARHFGHTETIRLLEAARRLS